MNIDLNSGLTHISLTDTTLPSTPENLFFAFCVAFSIDVEKHGYPVLGFNVIDLPSTVLINSNKIGIAMRRNSLVSQSFLIVTFFVATSVISPSNFDHN